MSLADRLAAAQRERGVSGAETVPAQTASPLRRRGRGAASDPFGDLKRAVHQALLDSLGPKLYDSRLTQAELEQRVRQTLQEVLAQDETPLTGRRPRPDRPGDRRRHPRLRAARALPARPRHHRGHGQRLRLDLHRAGRADPPGRRRRSPTRRTCAARSTRSWAGSDAGSTRPARWSTPACPTAAGSTPSSRRWRSTARCSPSASSPPTPYQVEDLIGFGTMTRAVSRTSSSACVRGKLNILVSGGTGAGKTTTLNVLSSFIPDDERVITIEDAAELQLHQEHVLRLESRPPNIEGKRRGQDPRPGPQLAADAARPHRRRRDPRRRRARHAAGDEHRPRRLDLHRARQHPPRRPLPGRDDGADGRHRPADARDPRAGGQRDRPDRPAGPVQGRHPAHHPHHRGRRAWRATSSRCRTCSSSTTAPASTRPATRSARLKSTGLRPEVPREARRSGVTVDPTVVRLREVRAMTRRRLGRGRAGDRRSASCCRVQVAAADETGRIVEVKRDGDALRHRLPGRRPPGRRRPGRRTRCRCGWPSATVDRVGRALDEQRRGRTGRRPRHRQQPEHARRAAGRGQGRGDHVPQHPADGRHGRPGDLRRHRRRPRSRRPRTGPPSGP